MGRKPYSAIGPGRMRHADGYDNLPSSPGIYRLVNKETGFVEYVGQSYDIRRRAYQHGYSGKYDPSTQRIEFSVAKPGTERDALCATEVEHISRHQPVGNRYRGGNGRR